MTEKKLFKSKFDVSLSSDKTQFAALLNGSIYSKGVTFNEGSSRAATSITLSNQGKNLDYVIKTLGTKDVYMTENKDNGNVKHFINAVAFRKTAEALAKLNPGDTIQVFGWLQPYGEEKNLQLIINSFTVVRRAENLNQGNQPQAEEPANKPALEEKVEIKQEVNYDDMIDIDDDDLPF